MLSTTELLSELDLRLEKLEQTVWRQRTRPDMRQDSRIPALATNFDIADTIFNPSVHVTRSNTQTITSAGGLTAISWDTEDWDSDDMWSSGAATRLIAPVDGLYRIWGRVDWATPDAGSRQLVRIRKDGVTVLDAGEAGAVTTAGAFEAQGVYAEYPLLRTNYVELMVQITVDVSTTINASAFTHFGMTYVRTIV